MVGKAASIRAVLVMMFLGNLFFHASCLYQDKTLARKQKRTQGSTKGRVLLVLRNIEVHADEDALVLQVHLINL